MRLLELEPVALCDLQILLYRGIPMLTQSVPKLAVHNIQLGVGGCVSRAGAGDQIYSSFRRFAVRPLLRCERIAGQRQRCSCDQQSQVNHPLSLTVSSAGRRRACPAIPIIVAALCAAEERTSPNGSSWPTVPLRTPPCKRSPERP